MKRFFTLLMLTLTLSAFLCVGAAASDFDSAAQDLSSIGMFRGTGKGFELDRAPTRGEAAIMLVRLYGAEEEAQAAYASGEFRHPFNDVPDWAAPHVAWLYSSGLTRGTSGTTFGTAQQCTAQNYVVFLLRALGYQDGTDFQYADAAVFAKQCGFYDASLFPGTFLRDDLAAVTYQALAANVKGTDTALLDRLIERGSIDQKAAKSLSDKIGAYRGMLEACGDMSADAMDLDITMKMKMTMDYDGEGETIDTVASGNIKVLGEKQQLSSSLTTTVGGDAVEQSIWMKDGWLYVSTAYEGDTFRYKTETDLTSISLSDAGLGAVPEVDVSSLAFIDSISSKKSGSNTVYTIKIGKNAASRMIGNLDEVFGADSLSVTVGDITASYTVSGTGSLTGMSVQFGADMAITVPADEETPETTLSMAYDYDIAVKVNRIGAGVTITFPDFSGYEELPADYAAMAALAA